MTDNSSKETAAEEATPDADTKSPSNKSLASEHRVNEGQSGEEKPVTSAQEPKEKTPPEKVAQKKPSGAAPEVNKNSDQRKKSSMGHLLLWVLVLLILAALTFAAYYAYGLWRAEQERVEQALINQQNEYQGMERNLQTLSETVTGVEAFSQQLQASLDAAQQKLASHNKRLLSLSNTSREDWLLAEAEYLLRLANQRLLTERATQGAEALLLAADDILKGIGDVDLFPIREAIARNRAALKLAPAVDREGIFLRLSGIASEITRLPPVRSRTKVPPRTKVPSTIAVPSTTTVPPTTAQPSATSTEFEEESAWRQTLRGWWQAVRAWFTRYVVIRHHEKPLAPLLPPENHQYLQLNLRFMLERAQLAMMREEQVVYQQSLQQARDWVSTYFFGTDSARWLDGELEELQALVVVHSMPDISESLELLRAYIERLHKLNSVKPQAPVAMPTPKPTPALTPTQRSAQNSPSSLPSSPPPSPSSTGLPADQDSAETVVESEQ